MCGNTSVKVRERTLYEYIGRVFSQYGCKYITQVGLGEKEPDLIIEFDGSQVVSEVKIDSEIKLEQATFDAVKKAFILKTPYSMALMFPKDVREIQPSELERVYPNLKVSALIFTEWLTDRTDLLTLDDLASLIVSHYRSWLRTKIPRVDYNLVVNIARGAIGEIASYLRSHLVVKEVLDSAMGVIGRFDIYKSMLEDVSGISEDEAKLYIADIAAYVLFNQLLFYQILSEKLGYPKYPDFNPIFPPDDLLDVIDKSFDNARSDYSKIMGLDIFQLLRETKDLRILYSIGRLVSTLKMLRPQNIQEDLFGRLYHETIPPETKKNLGAFYTKPEAAKLLATLAINKWDAKVLDPACGSGTLLVEAYQRKAQLAPSIERDKLHNKFAKEDIYGIDVMHFAAHMTATNLTSQNMRLKLETNVFSRDGVEALMNPIAANPGPPPTAEQTLDKWIETMIGAGIPKNFDIVIMNPPFTRRERIPDEISKLQKLVPQVKGKTGYWAYFVVPADNVLETEGTQGVVIPEEFFGGGSAKSVRKFLLERGYIIHFLVRSAVEVAFSEAAHYRDYLIVLKKGKREHPLVVSILKKKLVDVSREIESLALRLKDFALSKEQRLSLPEIEAIKVRAADEFVKRHIENLKPLIGFNTVKANIIALQLLDELKDKPTLKDLENKEICKIKVYNPGQYKTKGVENYARKLFASKYGSRGGSVTFLLDKVTDENVRLLLRGAKISETIPIDDVVFSLRTYSGVKHLNLSDEEEVAVIRPKALSTAILKLAGLLPLEKVLEAANDIEKAHNDLGGNFLLARKIRLTSPALYWLAYHCDNKILGTTSAMLNMHFEDKKTGKILVLYFNSIIVVLQLIAFMAETEGAWVTLHGRQVWSHVHTPDIENLSDEQRDNVIKLFAELSKSNVKSLFERIREHDEVQKSIDMMALELVGLNQWKSRLDEIYGAVADELESMRKILETSRER